MQEKEKIKQLKEENKSLRLELEKYRSRFTVTENDTQSRVIILDRDFHNLPFVWFDIGSSSTPLDVDTAHYLAEVVKKELEDIYLLGNELPKGFMY